MNEQAPITPAIQAPEEPMGNPDLYKDAAASAVRSGEPLDNIEGTINGIYDRQVTEAEAQVAEAKANDGANLLDESTAEQVAYAVKPDGDAAAALQKRIDNPYAKAAEEMKDGKGTGQFIGVESTRGLELQRKASMIDFERNSKKATHAAKMLGHLAVRGR